MQIEEKLIFENLANSIKEKNLFRSQRKAVNAGANGTLEYTIKEGVNKAEADEHAKALQDAGATAELK